MPPGISVPTSSVDLDMESYGQFTEAEIPEEVRKRRASLACIACPSRINIGQNYPMGMSIPPTLELYCANCRTISVYMHFRWNE